MSLELILVFDWELFGVVRQMFIVDRSQSLCKERTESDQQIILIGLNYSTVVEGFYGISAPVQDTPAESVVHPSTNSSHTLSIASWKNEGEQSRYHDDAARKKCIRMR